MSPDKGHGRTGRPSEKEFSFRYVGGVPYLLRDHSSLIRKGCHHLHKPVRLCLVSDCKFVMCTLSCEKRPEPSDSRAIEWRAILVFAVAIVVITVPRRAEGCFEFEE